jgi:uncharacterized membrane protein
VFVIVVVTVTPGSWASFISTPVFFKSLWHIGLQSV